MPGVIFSRHQRHVRPASSDLSAIYFTMSSFGSDAMSAPPFCPRRRWRTSKAKEFQRVLTQNRPLVSVRQFSAFKSLLDLAVDINKIGLVRIVTRKAQRADANSLGQIWNDAVVAFAADHDTPALEQLARHLVAIAIVVGLRQLG